MAFTPPQFPLLTPQQMGVPDVMASLLKGQQYGQNSQLFPQQLQHANLQNIIDAVKAKFAPSLAEQDLQKSKLFNQYYGQDILSKIGLQNAQSGNLGADTQKIKYMLSHPGLLAGGQAAQLQFIMDNPGLTQQLQNQLGNAPNGGNTPTSGGSSPTNIPGSTGASSGMNQSPNSYQMGSQNIPSLGQSILNNVIYGNALNPVQQTNLQVYKRNQENKADYGFKNLQEINKNAQEAQGLVNNIDSFESNFSKSTYKGPHVIGGGDTPTTGLTAGIRSIRHDFTPEMNTDSAAQNIQASLIPILFKAKITNQELSYLSTLKLNRSLTDQATKYQGALMRAVANRAQEHSKFYNAGISKGYDPYVLDALWNQYASERPVLDVHDNNKGQKEATVNKDLLDTSMDYLNQDAANSIASGKRWEPPITNSDIAHTAKVMHMTEDQVIAKLKQQGRL